MVMVIPFTMVKMASFNVYLAAVACCCLVTESCLTLCDPMGDSPPGSPVHGISQARILEWVATGKTGKGKYKEYSKLKGLLVSSENKGNLQ